MSCLSWAYVIHVVQLNDIPKLGKVDQNQEAVS